MGLAQPLVTVRLGQGQNTLNEQVSLLVTHWPRLHTLQPRAVAVLTMLLRPHRDEVTVKLALQGLEPPTSSDPTVRTSLPIKSSNTTTLVNGTVPQLVTIPLKVMVGLPLLQHKTTRLVLQCLVTWMQGAVQTVQVALFVAQTVFGASGAVSVPHATTVSVNGPHRFPVGL